MSNIPSCTDVVNGVLRTAGLQRIIVMGVLMSFSPLGRVVLILAGLVVLAGGIWMTVTAGTQALPAIIFWIIVSVLGTMIALLVVKMNRK